LEGPELCPYYNRGYYACFFEDPLWQQTGSLLPGKSDSCELARFQRVLAEDSDSWISRTWCHQIHSTLACAGSDLRFAPDLSVARLPLERTLRQSARLANQASAHPATPLTATHQPPNKADAKRYEDCFGRIFANVVIGVLLELPEALSSVIQHFSTGHTCRRGQLLGCLLRSARLDAVSLVSRTAPG